MAQKREKEETELKVPESLPICAKATAIPPVSPPQLTGIDDQKQQQQQQQLLLSSSARSSQSSDLIPNSASSSTSSTDQISDLVSKEGEENRQLKRPRPTEINRCAGTGCRRKIGLMGFRCRCGEVFCSEHRYSDRHACSYDYKAAGREAIARENPVVRAAKILKV